jgi:hypothetical protein
MADYVGIYGFAMTRPIQAAGISIEPCFTDHKDAVLRADDPDQFFLTAVAELPDQDARELAFDLAAALTFCQARWVIVTRPTRAQPGATLDQFKSKLPQMLDLPMRRQSDGQLIMEDTFEPGSRQQLLNLCIRQLQDAPFNEKTGFRSGLFRCVEALRMDPAYIDVTYYLHFSALEIMTHSIEGDGSFAPLATRLLRKYGFDVVQNDPSRPICSLQNYAHVRNGLFHKGALVVEVPVNQAKVKLKLTDYDERLRRLVPDVMLKILGFDDGHINWNRWLDRMPF